MKKAFFIRLTKLKQTFLESLRGQSSCSCHWTAEGAAGAQHVFAMHLHQTTKITLNLTSFFLLLQLCQHSWRGLVWW